jgi:hypothetical protein
VPFDDRALAYLRDEQEVEVETLRPDGSPRRTIIWTLVDGTDVFVRSWKGDRGYWYQSATEPDARVALIIAGQTVPVAVHDASDAESVTRCSRQLELKYRGNDSLEGMLRPSVLGTTLRLEPLAAD